MKALIDTSSLISFVRYYLPFDQDNKLKDFLEKQILEKAYNEYLDLKKANLWGNRKYF